jgi:predicted SprT family Zn-dependent metalloprotease
MAALYRNLVAPNHVNCVTIEEAVQQYIEKGRKLFGDVAMGKVSAVLIEYFDKGKAAAMATVGTYAPTGKIVGLIQFSMRLVCKRLLTMIKQIVPHELAHVICMANGWDMGHGRIWKQVCMMLGGNGNTHHTMEAVDGRYKKLYEALCDDGYSHWLTGPQRRIAASTGLVAVTGCGREITLTKKSLTGNIKPIT